MKITAEDIKTIIDAVTALIIAVGIIYTAYKANGVKKTVDTIEYHVNSTATKAQETIRELREQLMREKEISAEKTQVAAVLQASGGQRVAEPKSSPLKKIEVNTKETVETLKEIKERGEG